MLFFLRWGGVSPTPSYEALGTRGIHLVLTGGPTPCPKGVTGGFWGPPMLGGTHMALAPSCLYNFGH